MNPSVVVRWTTVDELDDTRLGEVALGDAERERAAAFRLDTDRRLFVGARLLLRRTVAEVTGERPDAVVLVQRCARCDGPHGRPQVQVGGRPGPSVSIAHAGTLAVVAVAPDPVGVDVEPSSPARRRAVLFDLGGWVRREAVLKALGLGVDTDPDPFELGPPDEPPRLVRWSAPGPRPTVHLTDLAPATDHVAAVATLGRRRLTVDAGPVAFRRR